MSMADLRLIHEALRNSGPHHRHYPEPQKRHNDAIASVLRLLAEAEEINEPSEDDVRKLWRESTEEYMANPTTKTTVARIFMKKMVAEYNLFDIVVTVGGPSDEDRNHNQVTVQVAMRSPYKTFII